MADCLALVLVACTVAACTALQWTFPSPVTNDSTVHACEGESVSLPWSYTTGPGEQVVGIEWYFHHTSGVASCCRDQDGWERCMDKHLDGCQGIYVAWAQAHCQAFCGYCEPCPLDPCVDKLANCAEYGDYSCQDPSMRLWAYTNCRAHCALCDNYGYYWELYPNATRSSGQTNQLLATYSSARFQKRPTVNQRLEFVPPAGIRLLNVSISAFGTYSVHVKVNAHGATEDHVKELLLAEPELVLTNDSRVYAELAHGAVLDATTGEWHVQLSCGHFVGPDQPSVFVIWTTPSGSHFESNSYADGHFLLNVPNPVMTGEYSCRLNITPSAGSCARVVPTLLEKATVTLDSIKVEVAILTARLHALEQDNGQLRQENTRLRQQLQGSGSTGQENNIIRNCDDLKQNLTSDGVYTIYPDSSTPIKSLCERGADNGAWTVIQKRQDGSVDFNRNWADYEAGFGDLQSEFWLGLKNIHLLTSNGQYSLRVELTDWDGSLGVAEYNTFYIDGTEQSYRLHVSGYNGTAGDSLSATTGSNDNNADRLHTNQPFSTPDHDNDQSPNNCAVQAHSGWWFNHCAQCNLNGQYGPEGTSDWHYVIWFSWKQDFRSFKKVEMKIRPRS